MSEKKDKPYKMYAWANNLYIVKDNIYQYFKAANTTQWISYSKKTILRFSVSEHLQSPEHIKDLSENELFLELL